MKTALGAEGVQEVWGENQMRFRLLIVLPLDVSPLSPHFVLNNNWLWGASSLARHS